jgi:NAD(P)H-flavin reductase
MQRFTAPLLRSIQLAHDVFQYDFAWESDYIPYKTGQFFILQMSQEDGKMVTRSYSISSNPNEKGFFSLCVKLLPDGKGSTFLKNLNLGDGAAFMGPFGHFTLTDSKKPVLMVATGTGLAPFMGMIPFLFEQGFDQPITLVFGVRHQEDLFYLDQLKTWEDSHPNFKALVTLSQASEDWTGLHGRVTDHLEEATANPSNLQVYICGNGDMVKTVKTLMEEKGILKEDLHFELFTPIK